MAAVKYKFDYKEPENIKSEVPGEQNIREGGTNSNTDEISTLEHGDTVENPKKYVLSPVVTITTNEATFTKGDLKLQKISVTENISETQNGDNPISPEGHVFSQVPPKQSIRMDPPEDRKTRIPMRFKNAVNRVRREKSVPNESDGEISLPSQRRRSSIPRLKKPRPDSPKPEIDEFDKIYDEIVDSSVDIDVSLLNNKVEDPTKVEDRFEEIIHDYDEGIIKPITIDDIAKNQVTERAEPKKASTAETEKAKTVHNDNRTTREKPGISTEIKKPIDKLKDMSKSVSENTIHARRKSVDKAVNAEKPKSRIPMLKRRSEPEIVVPQTIPKLAQSKSFRDRVRVHNAVSRFSDAKEKKSPSRIAITKKEVNNDNSKKPKTPLKNVKNEEKHVRQIENVEMHSSYESDISPDNIIKVDVSEKPKNVKEENNTIEIVELTPTETIDEYQEITIEPSIIEYVDIPTTVPILENNNEAYIEEIIVQNPTILETENESVEIENTPNSIEFKLSPVKLASKEDIEEMAKTITLKPQVIQMKSNTNTNDTHDDNIETEKEVLPVETITLEATPINTDVVLNEINNNSEYTNLEQDEIKIKEIEKAPINEEIDTKNNSIEDISIPKGKVSRIINRLSSREDKDKTRKDALVSDNKPRAKSVLSKIAIFERQAPASNPKSRDFRPKPGLEREPNHKPKIIDEVLKPLPQRPNPNDNPNKVYNPINNKRFEENTVTEKVEVNVKAVAVATAIQAEEIISEDITSNESKPYDNYSTDEISKTNGDTEGIQKTVDEIRLQPIEVEYEDKTQLKEFQSKVNGNKDDTVFINHVEKTAQFDAAKKREIESPFNFKPKDYSRRDDYKSDCARRDTKESPYDFRPSENKNRLYKDEDNRLNESPSLDYDLNRLGRYKSRNEDTNLRKAKSVAELDLGDAVKGRVHEMIVRMKSVDKAAEKREVISAKERPRKKSVSEKIALFEGKLSIAPSHNTPPRSAKRTAAVEYLMSPDELQVRIAELSEAKENNGRCLDATNIVLGNGMEMPVLSIGTALLDKILTPYTVMSAITLGYRGIDTAWIYGNEHEVGLGIQSKINQGFVKREDLFITNKLWSTFHRTDMVEEACRRSLDNMGLKYFDLYLIHNPMSFREGLDPIPKIANVIQYSEYDFMDAWVGMERLVEAGLVRSIGLSNFSAAQVQRIFEKAKIKPVVNMVECHPYLSQQRLSDFCAERDIKLYTYGVLGSKGTPLEIRGTNAAAIDDPLIQCMAAGLGVTPAQLLIRFQIEGGHAVAAKSSTGAHLWENLMALTFTLTESQMNDIKTLNKNRRTFTFKGYQIENGHTVAVKASTGAHLADNLTALTFTLTEGQMDAMRSLNRNKRSFTFKGMGDTHKNYPFNVAF